MPSDPNVWGPHVWAAVHLIALGAPTSFDSSTQAGYRNFFANLPYVLPCKSCQEHLLDIMTQKGAMSLDNAFVSGRDSLFLWTVNIHNSVNRRLGKPTMTVEDAMSKWNNLEVAEKSNIGSGSRAEAYGIRIAIAALAALAAATALFALIRHSKGGRRK